MAGAFHPLDWDDEYFGSLLGVKIPFPLIFGQRCVGWIVHPFQGKSF